MGRGRTGRARSARVLLAIVLAAAWAAGEAHALRAGDLLVVDATNARVLHVDPVTKAVTTHSPREEQLESWLAEPTGIAIDGQGVAYVTDAETGYVVTIAPDGTQSRLQECSGPIDCTPLVFDEPRAIALRPDGPFELDLFIVAADGLHRIDLSLLLPQSSRTPLHDDAGWSVALVEGAELEAVWTTNGAETAIRAWNPSNGMVTTAYEEDQTGTAYRISDLAVRRDGSTAVPLALRAQYYCGDPTVSGVSGHAGTRVPLSQGGDLRCPRARAVAPTVEHPRYYVADTDGGGGDPRIVRLQTEPPGDTYEQEVIAPLPAGGIGIARPLALAVSPVTVPEPSAGGVALAAVAALPSLRAAARRASRSRA